MVEKIRNPIILGHFSLNSECPQIQQFTTLCFIQARFLALRLESDMCGHTRKNDYYEKMA